MNKQLNFYAVILAAGQGNRLQNESGIKKQFLPYRNAPLWWQSVETFSHCPKIKGLVLVFPEDEYQNACEEAKNHTTSHTVPLYFAKGGIRRQDSVFNGLKTLPTTCTHVLIHDSARPFFTSNLVHCLIQPFFDSHQKDKIIAVIPALPLTDTIKNVETYNGSEAYEGSEIYERVKTSIPRDTLRAVQTPQAFNLEELLIAHKHAHQTKADATDDAMLMEALNLPVHVIMGEKNNYKITHAEDMSMLVEQTPPTPCTGYGYDVHRFGGNRPLMLGGINIPSPLQITAHSDGDVLLHALMDAMLSCLCMGDIGTLFPDTDPKYDNISSSLLLTHVIDLWKNKSIKLCHIDLTVITQKPKISPFSKQIRNNIARLLEIPPESINIKATTEEGLGFTGEGLGIKAVALVSAIKIV